jgi:bifunctional N-acetylglucosamine-1-phosphate-uridyltransferase/glucosamine-1-phosphate-acetyltransferase GlmU-like protein
MALSLLTIQLDEPTAGRIIRDGKGKVVAIVEQKMRRLNSAPARNQHRSDSRRRRRSSVGSPALAIKCQWRYYLTDVVALAVDEGAQSRRHGPAA